MDFGTNPFFKHDMDKLCAICMKKLESFKTHNIFERIPKTDPQMNVFEILSLISDFKIENGPQKVCTICFQNTAAANKFRQMCNTAHENIYHYMDYQEKMKLKSQSQNEGNEEEGQSISDIKLENGIDQPLIKTESEELAEPQDPPGEEKGRKNRYLLARYSASKRIKCKVCHKILRNDYMPLHMRTHTGEKPYICKDCNKAFATSTSLRIHSVIHSDHKRFVCNYCGNAFKLIRQLKCHERIHTGEKPYKCKVCEKPFTNSTCLKNHMLVHTKEKRFTCELCAKGFGRKTKLTEHLRSHAGIKRHECHLCGKRFTQAHSMRAHLRLYCPVKKNPPGANTEIMNDISVDELLRT